MATDKEIIQQARALCVKFVNKVESGMARSKVTYQECVDLLRVIDEQDVKKEGENVRNK